AFHRFDPEKTKAEFARVLIPGGLVMLIWNERSLDETPFLRAYERLLTDRCPEYSAISAQHANPRVLQAFFEAGMSEERFYNEQVFDWEGVKGRALSSSYVPTNGPEHDTFMAELKKIFLEHSDNGKLSFVYATQLFYGSVST
ncbi:MAG TPA: SAM-dependent methyltransferase, partial [Thermoanaerobaculia bacterium]